MRKLLIIVMSIFVWTSCKEPAPIYFNRPIGKLAIEFDESLQGGYFNLDDLMERGWDGLMEQIESEGDSILMEEFQERMESALNPPEVPDTCQLDEVTRDSSSQDKLKKPSLVKTEDSLAINFNRTAYEVIYGWMVSYIDEAKYYAYVLSKNKLQIFTIDTTENINSYTLIELSDTLKLTTYADRYFLNFKTPLGWEILQIQELEGILYFKAIGRAVYNSDASPQDIKSLEASMSSYYKNLRPIFDDDGQVIGFKARLRTRKLIETFDEKEKPWLRLISFF